ncbi:MAG: lipoyl(octanoyl) transferase LipB [Candidatus Xiphinematobacter sp.]|nr:MAG: lipoyl(octanoyl) transferase LipB [Candidatus Xiphinematobacter sp.]QQY08623.1 MAG: lipoyl(octanoyl) transferase LipB [Candidatus Xiphinematobacter sp.]QQY09358.1 MAG: lipoyl(octanoyl) transferase LipB [Candidatus Xiphinematobacter sp.]QQY10108.1 MAG: lipoyl(octanoyl) transferase LipB [Candidatus Xiphinematobacter sp.]QQY10843.1 MAG: lipoyl(octanoyl) transferase LipB [Candidatus Xiphinematobacter sp.]
MDAPTVEWLGRIPYRESLFFQKYWVEKTSSCGEERLLFLEHEPVFTVGKIRDKSSLLDPALLPFPVYHTNRGGQATYHGPGQLICYPILNLSSRGRDLHRYLRFLERVLIALMRAYGLSGRRRKGFTGAWVENRKIASIGIGVRQWVSMHGFAFNVTKELTGFSAIVPCGISGVVMTSLSQEIGSEVGVYEVVEVARITFLSLLESLPNGQF